MWRVKPREDEWEDDLCNDFSMLESHSTPCPEGKKVAGQKGRTEHAEDVLTHSGAEGTDYLVLAFHVF